MSLHRVRRETNDGNRIGILVDHDRLRAPIAKLAGPPPVTISGSYRNVVRLSNRTLPRPASHYCDRPAAFTAMPLGFAPLRERDHVRHAGAKRRRSRARRRHSRRRSAPGCRRERMRGRQLAAARLVLLVVGELAALSAAAGLLAPYWLGVPVDVATIGTRPRRRAESQHYIDLL